MSEFGLYVDYSGNIMGYMWNVACIFVQGHIPIMWSVYVYPSGPGHTPNLHM